MSSVAKEAERGMVTFILLIIVVPHFPCSYGPATQVRWLQGEIFQIPSLH